MSWRRLHSRSAVPTAPRKYLVVTMLAAFTLQKPGNSTPRCSKLTEPSRQFVMTTSRRSQVTSSYGCTPSLVHTRPRRSPALPPAPGRLTFLLPAPDDAPTASVIPGPPRSCGPRPRPLTLTPLATTGHSSAVHAAPCAVRLRVTVGPPP